MKRILSLVLCLLLAAGMTATAEETSWQEKLSQVEGVISVEAIPLDASAQFFEEKYLVTFEQPLDWSDPDAGSFPQRVEIGLRGEAQYVVMETGGYSLNDKIPGAADGMASWARMTRRRSARSLVPITST